MGVTFELRNGAWILVDQTRAEQWNAPVGKPIGSPTVYIRSILRRSLINSVLSVLPPFDIYRAVFTPKMQPTFDRCVELIVDLIETAVQGKKKLMRGNRSAANSALRHFQVSVVRMREHNSNAQTPWFESTCRGLGGNQCHPTFEFTCDDNGKWHGIVKSGPYSNTSRPLPNISNRASVLNYLHAVARNADDPQADVFIRLPETTREFSFPSWPHEQRAINRLKWPLRQYMAERLYRPGSARMRANMNAALAETM